MRQTPRRTLSPRALAQTCSYASKPRLTPPRTHPARSPGANMLACEHNATDPTTRPPSPRALAQTCSHANTTRHTPRRACPSADDHERVVVAAARATEQLAHRALAAAVRDPAGEDD